MGSRNLYFDFFDIYVLYFSAACGGIIGLCVGFSLLSGVELIYFFTLRMWVDHRRAQSKKKKVAVSANGTRA